MTPAMILTELAVVLMVVLLVTLFLALPVLVVIAVVGVANMVRCRRTGDASGARSRLHGLSMVMNMTLADLLVLAVLADHLRQSPRTERGQHNDAEQVQGIRAEK